MSPEAFLSLTKQVQAMAGMMQMLVLLIPQIVRLVAPPIDRTQQRPSREQVGMGEAREQTTNLRGPTPYRITPPCSELNTISSDSADDSFRVQLSHVNQRLDKFQHEFQKSRSKLNEGGSGGSPFTQEIQDKPIPLNFRLSALETTTAAPIPRSMSLRFGLRWPSMAPSMH